jgi:mannose-1-phosphate guanylyltransferase / mannose-6-phosphate isomerase
VWREAEADASGTVTAGPASALDCQDTLLRATSEAQTLFGIGLKNIVVVAMPDAVLVADKDRAQDVKQAVAALKAKSAPQA